MLADRLAILQEWLQGQIRAGPFPIAISVPFPRRRGADCRAKKSQLIKAVVSRVAEQDCQVSLPHPSKRRPPDPAISCERDEPGSI